MEQTGRLTDAEPWIVASLGQIVNDEPEAPHFGFVVDWTTPLFRYNVTNGGYLYDNFETADALFEFINGVPLRSLSPVRLESLLDAEQFREPDEGP